MPATDRPTALNEACDHPVADHRHGTLVCHNMDECRCDDCRGANRRYERHRKSWLGEFPKQKAPLVDAAPAAEHVLKLMEQGMGLKRIGEMAGVAPSAIGHIVYGRGGSHARKAEKVRRTTAEKLLAVTLNLADGAKVDATEAWLIVDELEARGWTRTAIAKRITNPNARGLQLSRNLVFAGNIRALRRLLHEPVPLRKHNPTGKLYRPNPDYVHQDVPRVTPGVTTDPETKAPTGWAPRSPEWLAEMRAGLKKAVEASYQRHGRVAA